MTNVSAIEAAPVGRESPPASGPVARSWPMAIGSIVGLLLCGAVAVACGLIVARVGDERSLMVAAIGAILGGAMLLLAITRFSTFLIISIAVRASLDGLKLAGADGRSGTDPGVLVGAVLLLSCVLWLLAQRSAGTLVRPSRTALWLMAFAGAAVLSAVGSNGMIDSLQTAARVLAGALTFAVLEQLFARRPGLVRPLLAAAALSLLVPAAVAIGQLLNPDENYVFTEVSRIQGTFVHPNSFASYLVAVAATALAVVFASRGAARTAAIAICALSSTLVLFSYARGAWVALILCAAYLLAKRNRALLLGLIAAGVAVVIFVPSVSSRFADLSGEPTVAIGAGTANSMEWRLGYWQEILPLWSENPVSGIGLDQVVTRTAAAAEPHSGFVQAIVETGTLGFVALIGLIVALWRDLAAARRRATNEFDRWLAIGATAVAAGFLVQLFTENLLTQVAIHLYLWIPIAYATSMLLRLPSDNDTSSELTDSAAGFSESQTSDRS
jgi:putative inorganic carbon (HCO3(-)) transporter